MTLRALALVAIVVCVPAASMAADARYAIVIGVNAGDANETILRYAEADAHRVAETMRNVGNFLPENIVVLTAVKGEDVRRAMIA